MTFEAVGATPAVGSVTRQLSLGSCSPSDSRFEILRATVWSLAAPAARAHVNRVVGSALPVWQFLSGRAATSHETLRAELRAALSTLADAGDLLELPGGYWAPATTRLVELPDGVGHLVVGGVPSSLLDVEDDRIQFHGPHRHLSAPPSELPVALPVEPLGSWANLPTDAIQDWARDVVSSFERRPYSPASDDAFEFYRPADAGSGTPQFKRWSEDAGNTSGTLLARRRRLYGARESRLVDVNAGRIVSSCELPGVDVRRLMYAFDITAGTPVRAQQLRAGHQPEWLFTSELPRPEQRAFTAFGTLTIPDDRPWERRWTFVRNQALALKMIRDLGIVLQSSNGEPRR